MTFYNIFILAILKSFMIAKIALSTVCNDRPVTSQSSMNIYIILVYGTDDVKKFH